MSTRTHCTRCLLTQRRQVLTRSKLLRPNPVHTQLFRPFSSQSTATPKTSADDVPSPQEPISNPQHKQLINTLSPPPSATRQFAEGVRKAAPSLTETYVAYGVCEALVRECSRVADYQIPQANDKNAEIPKNEKGEDMGVGESWWYQNLGMAPTFNTWAQITFLHMYLLTVRLRSFPKEHAPTWHRHLTDHFFHQAEDRMITMHRLNARMTRSKYLKDLFNQWRGLTFAYDEGLVKGDAVLASAVWRNVCKGDDSVDLRRLAEIVSYMRSVLAAFDEMEDAVIASGDVVFDDPSAEEGIVKSRSRLLDPTVDTKPHKIPAKPLSPARRQKS